jgi:hypothetical protein
MAIKKEALAQVKKQQADAAYLHAVDPNFAKTGFTLGDVSKLKTINPGTDPYAVADEYGNVPDTSYQQDPYGRRVAFSPYQGVDNEGNPQGSPEYRQLTNVGGKQVQVFYDDKGNFKNAIGDDIKVNGHGFTPIYNQKGQIVKYEATGEGGFEDFAKMVALSALTAGVGSAFGGASGLGQSLFGLSGTAGQLAGGAALGAGRAAISGGSLQDILKQAALGGLGSAGNLGIGDTGFTVGQAMTAVNALKAAEKGDWMNAIAGAASLSGAGNTQIGDTGYTLGDLAKNAKLAQAVLSGNPQAIIGAITRVAGSANKDIIQSLTDAGMSRPQANDFIEGYFAPGGEGYVDSGNNPAGGFTSQWQTSGSDRIMIQDDGSAIAINENGDPYSLTKEQVDQMVNNGQLNTAASGYVAATGGTGNTPGGTRTAATQTPAGGTKTTTPATQTTTPAASTTTASSPTTTRVGLDPLDVAKMKSDVAHIKAMEELFGGSIYDQTPASSAHDQTDIVEAATGGQVYSGGGDIHALLQLLRS